MAHGSGLVGSRLCPRRAVKNSQEYARVKEVFLVASELSLEQRKDYLDGLALDAALRKQVEELLYYDAEPLDLPAPVVDRDQLNSVWEEQAPLPDVPGFRVHSLLGEGGMGEVYLAEQIFPRRQVALKLVRGARFTAQALRRFREEISPLGLLQHPGITQVYAADPTGEESHGRPYFAMEYINGQILTEYADQQHLDRDARLALMAKVCDAAHYAHQQGVVHRDLKPANVLVDTSGQPKILDFGIARAVGEQFETRTLLTGSEHVVGTMGYMAPEQFKGRIDGVGPRSDVYALGVLMFELLTGRLPHELEGLNLFEAGQRITETDATRISRVVRAHRGELELIAQKALQRDAQQRYASAGDLADDLRRYLAGDPILTRPPSLAYRARKFLQRQRRASLAAGLALALVIVASSFWLSWPNPLNTPNQAAAPFLRGDRVLLQINGKALDARFGSEVISPGDLDGDGVPDLVVGSPMERGDEMVLGAVRVFSGAQLDGEPLYRLTGQQAGDCFGHRVHPAGDLDSDGAADFWVMDGHQLHPTQGRLTAISGARGETLRVYEGTEMGFIARRNFATVQDRDGDGFRDLLVAALKDGLPTLEQVTGPLRPGVTHAGLGELILISAQSGKILQRIDGVAMTPEDRFPFKIVEVDDYDGDGVSEVLVSSKFAGSGGHAQNGVVQLYSGANWGVLHTWYGDLDGGHFGASICALGDVTGDGVGEIGIGASLRDSRGPKSGSVYVFDGADFGKQIARIDGRHFDGRFGIGLASIGDLTGDGFAEVGVGASSYQYTAEYGGALFIYDLHPPGGGEPIEIYASHADHGASALGYPVRQIADFDGDGFPEFAGGMASYGRHLSQAGALRIFSSRALRKRLATK
jgi:serine/threonine protein kinase